MDKDTYLDIHIHTKTYTYIEDSYRHKDIRHVHRIHKHISDLTHTHTSTHRHTNTVESYTHKGHEDIHNTTNSFPTPGP